MNVIKPHLSLNVSNIDASVAFYEEVFQVKVQVESTEDVDAAWSRFEGGNETKADGGCCS